MTVAASPVVPSNLPRLEAPILVTTCGQGPGGQIVASMCRDVGIPCVSKDLLYAGDLGADCPPDAETYYAGVLFVATGASAEGMEAAGVNVESEARRCTALIERAKELGMVVIVGQVDGIPQSSSGDDSFLRGISSLADLLITPVDADEDGYFTALAEERGISQIILDETCDLRTLLLLLFRPAG